jgi:hypothetical protein
MNGSIRSLVDARYNVQKLRIAFENREGAIERGTSRPFRKKGDKEYLAVKYAKIFDDLEDELTKDLISEAELEPIIEQLSQLSGINYITAAQLCSMIDITKCPTISSLWRYAGYGCNKDGEIDRLRKGERACFNKRLKCLLHVIATNFLRCRSGSPFKAIYDNAKKKYLVKLESGEWEKKGGWKMHAHMAALRKVKKIFLATLWTRWRMIEDLPTRSPYIEEYMGHTKIYKPEDFGWPVAIKVKDVKVKRKTSAKIMKTKKGTKKDIKKCAVKKTKVN